MFQMMAGSSSFVRSFVSFLLLIVSIWYFRQFRVVYAIQQNKKYEMNRKKDASNQIHIYIRRQCRFIINRNKEVELERNSLREMNDVIINNWQYNRRNTIGRNTRYWPLNRKALYHQYYARINFAGGMDGLSIILLTEPLLRCLISCCASGRLSIRYYLLWKCSYWYIGFRNGVDRIPSFSVRFRYIISVFPLSKSYPINIWRNYLMEWWLPKLRQLFDNFERGVIKS